MQEWKGEDHLRVHTKNDESLAKMWRVDVERKKCINDWGNTNYSHTFVLGDWVYGASIYRDKTFVFANDHTVKWEKSLGIIPWYAT